MAVKKVKAEGPRPIPLGAVGQVTVTADGWVESQPKSQRPRIMKMIFSLASEFGWSVQVEGQSWDAEFAV